MNPCLPPATSPSFASSSSPTLTHTLQIKAPAKDRAGDAYRKRSTGALTAAHLTRCQALLAEFKSVRTSFVPRTRLSATLFADTEMTSAWKRCVLWQN
jgi:hypothetical protein